VRRVDSEAAAQVMRRAGFAPVEPYQSPRTPWECRGGKCKRLVKVKLANVQRGFKRCPECRNDERITVMRAAGAQPLIPYPGARERWLCQCTRCPAQIEPSYDNVRRGQGACRYCVGQGPVTDEQARQEIIDVGVEPLEPYPGDVHAPWRCRCLTCGTPVTPSRANALRQHPRVNTARRRRRA
jgi:hypothetical protein